MERPEVLSPYFFLIFSAIMRDVPISLTGSGAEIIVTMTPHFHSLLLLLHIIGFMCISINRLNKIDKIIT